MQVSQKQFVDIDFKNITYCSGVKGNDPILKGVNGQFRSGNLIGILGPSGAGKTTLLNILAGYLIDKNISGRIYVNGKEREMRKFKKISCYIMQEDILQKQLSVAEIMILAANLKLGRLFSSPEKRKIVRTVVRIIGLDQCLHTRTENLSGGQLKRLAIALELINNPPVMFLDEPTTGLDNVVVKQCIELLKTLANQGRTIICTIHQPSDSLLSYFDQMYILANGYCVYNGSVPKMMSFLENLNLSCPTNYNPTEYMIELVNMNAEVIKILSTASNNGISDANCHIFNAKQATARRQTTVENLFTSKITEEWNDFPNPYYVQVAILLKRMFVQMSRNKMMLTIQLFHHIVSSLSLGLSFSGVGNNGAHALANFKFFIGVMLFYCYTYIMSPILLFPFEIELIRREYFNRWFSLKAYYTALTFCNIPPMFLFGIIFNIIIYTLTDQPMEAMRFFYFNVVCLLSALTSYGLGITIGSIFKAAPGTCVGSALGVYLLLLCMHGMGYGENVPFFVKMLMLSTFPRHGLIGICTSLLRGRPLMNCDEVFCYIRDPDDLLQIMGMGDAKLGVTITVLVVLLVVHRVAAYAALKWKLSSRSTGSTLF